MTAPEPETTDFGPHYSAQQAPPLPPHNVGWSLVALLFFWPLAFSAFTHTMNVYPL